MATNNTGAHSEAGSETTGTEDGDTGTQSDATRSPVDEIVQAAKDAAHAVIGFGVIGWNKTQVRRRELITDLNGQRHHVEAHLDDVKEHLATAIRHLDARIEPVRHDIDDQLDKVSERLPEQVREFVQSARKIARDTEHQVRQAVGAL